MHSHTTIVWTACSYQDDFGNKLCSPRSTAGWRRYHAASTRHLKRQNPRTAWTTGGDTRPSRKKLGVSTGYQRYVRYLIEEDSPNNLWRLVENKRNDTSEVGLSLWKLMVSRAVIARWKQISWTTSSVRLSLQRTQATCLHSPHPTMPEISIGENGFFKLLSNLNPRKAATPDNIPCPLLTETARELRARAFTLLFNISITTGQIRAI